MARLLLLGHERVAKPTAPTTTTTTTTSPTTKPRQTAAPPRASVDFGPNQQLLLQMSGRFFLRKNAVNHIRQPRGPDGSAGFFDWRSLTTPALQPCAAPLALPSPKATTAAAAVATAAEPGGGGNPFKELEFRGFGDMPAADADRSNAAATALGVIAQEQATKAEVLQAALADVQSQLAGTESVLAATTDENSNLDALVTSMKEEIQNLVWLVEQLTEVGGT